MVSTGPLNCAMLTATKALVASVSTNRLPLFETTSCVSFEVIFVTSVGASPSEPRLICAPEASTSQRFEAAKNVRPFTVKALGTAPSPSVVKIFRPGVCSRAFGVAAPADSDIST